MQNDDTLRVRVPRDLKARAIRRASLLGLSGSQLVRLALAVAVDDPPDEDQGKGRRVQERGEDEE